MSAQSELLDQLETERWNANVGGDIAKLDALLSEDLRFVHPTSKVDTKESYLEGLRTNNSYLDFEVDERDILLLGSTAVISSSMLLIARRPPLPKTAYRSKSATRRFGRSSTVNGDWSVIRPPSFLDRRSC